MPSRPFGTYILAFSLVILLLGFVSTPTEEYDYDDPGSFEFMTRVADFSIPLSFLTAIVGIGFILAYRPEDPPNPEE